MERAKKNKRGVTRVITVLILLLLLVGISNQTYPGIIKDILKHKGKAQSFVHKHKRHVKSKLLKDLKKVFHHNKKKQQKRKPNPVADKNTVTSPDANSVHKHDFTKHSFSKSKTLPKPLPAPKQMKEYNIDSGVVVYGWHGKSSEAYYREYNYSLLTHLSCFAYYVDPITGGMDRNKYNLWNSTRVIPYAKEKNPKIKVQLTAALFGTQTNGRFLTNPMARKNFISTIISALRSRRGDGVCIDFEGVSAKHAHLFTSFIEELDSSFFVANKSYTIDLVLPQINNGAFEIKKLMRYVDLFILVGYDYYGAWSAQAGPISPLLSSPEWGDLSIEHSFKKYVSEGINPTDVVLGVPYFGAVWQTESKRVPSKVLVTNGQKRFLNDRHYTYIMTQAPKPVLLDSASVSAYITYPSNPRRTTFRQIWFDSKQTLQMKYQWSMENKMRGIGIWTLGFDHGRKELWELIHTEFASGKYNIVKVAADSTDNDAEDTDGKDGEGKDNGDTKKPSANDTTAAKPGMIDKVYNFVETHPSTSRFAAVVLTIFALGGVVFTILFNQKVRTFIVENKLKVVLGTYALLLSIATIAYYFAMKVFYISLAIIGVITIVLLYVFFRMNRKDLP